MNPEFVWAIIVIFLALALGAAAIGLYFYWKDDKDYDENKKIIVWGLAIGSIITIICGILLLVWGIQKKRHIDTTKKTAKQNDKLAATAAKQSQTAPPQTIPMVSQQPATPPPKSPAPLSASAASQPVAYAAKGDTSRTPTTTTSQRTSVQFAKPGSTSYT